MTVEPSRSSNKTNSMEKELEALGRFRMGKIVGGKWKITQKLDEGGFGSVYKVQNLMDPRLYAALKIELSRQDEANHLKLETEVMKELHADGFRSHIPTLYRSGKKKSYCYMIISLLGENLRRLKDKHFSKGMPMRTLTRVGIQALYAIKTMHDRGYVHRDIKPGNFVLGYYGTAPVARFVYIIDFGLVRAFAYPPSSTIAGGRWLARKARGSLDFKGTWRFASPTMHEKKEQGRKDDLWSFLYMLIELYCGLPWEDDDDKKTVETKKLNMNDNDLMIRMPEEFKFIPKHLRTLDVYQRPDYYRIFLALDKVRMKCNVKFEDPYEWELREYAQANERAMNRLQPQPGYLHADAFFNWDPLLINGPPSQKDVDEIKIRFKSAPTNNNKEQDDQKPDSGEHTGANSTTGTGTGGAVTTTVTVAPTVAVGVSGKRTKKSAESAKKAKTRKAKKKYGNLSCRKKISMSEDSSDFVPSCYTCVNVPIKCSSEGRNERKEKQKDEDKMDWGGMAGEETKGQENGEGRRSGPMAFRSAEVMEEKPVVDERKAISHKESTNLKKDSGFRKKSLEKKAPVETKK